MAFEGKKNWHGTLILLFAFFMHSFVPAIFFLANEAKLCLYSDKYVFHADILICFVVVYFD